MTEQWQIAVWTFALIFCRVGMCLMVMPGISSPHVLPRVRLMVALACTLALAPSLWPVVSPAAAVTGLSAQAALVFSESLIGLIIGLVGRLLFLGLDFAGNVIASFLGLGGMPGVALEEAEPSTALAALIGLAAAALIFATDLHLEIIKGLSASYGPFRVGVAFEVRPMLGQVLGALSAAFIIALKVAGPFLIYSIVINLLFGLANKMVPQVPIYFVAAPLVLIGGLGLLTLAIPDFLIVFMRPFESWLREGRL